MTVLLIDGDILIYQALLASEQEIEWEPDLFTLLSNLSDAKDAFIGSLFKIIHASGLEKYHLALSDKENWRKDVFPSYKANRKNTRKPLGFKEFGSWVRASYPTITKPTLEADDVIGILATKPGADTLIWSIDKDFKTIPGNHLKPDGIHCYTENEANYWHMMQTLTGDAVDGYPGCKGIGAVKAERILDDWPQHEHWAAVVHTYAKAGFTEEYALVQARVARICRWDNWDQAKQEVVLWSPK